MKFTPHEYQQRAIQRVIDQERAGLFLDMGLGKTVITLTAVKALIEDYAVTRVLVIAPKRVAEDTWSREAAKWDHLQDLRVSPVLGDPRQRVEALNTDADVYVIGRDNVQWLVERCRRHWPFDMVVIDELSSFKNPQAKRFRALRRVIPAAERVVGLTGTPSPNGLMDLWAEVYLLDQGERLQRTIGAYRELYFKPGASNGHVVYQWIPQRGAAQKIEQLLSDLCVSMSAADYLQLPDRIDNVIPVRLDPEEMAKYRKMEHEQILLLEDDQAVVTALSAAAVMNKLLQMANGCVYTDGEGYAYIHARKLEALQEIIEATQEPVLVFYGFRHDRDTILQTIPGAQEVTGPEGIAAWNEGRIPVLLAHPASVG